MKVFISWSGETSKNIAEILRQWLPSVIQVVKPYYSPDDIAKGTRWSSEIAKELDESKVGVICLTKDNLSSPWIMFEAGALSKNIDKSKVCPILFGVDPSDIQGPLVQFQAAKFTKEEVKKVVRMINSELGESSLSSEVFENVFDMWWPKLQERIDGEMNKARKTNGKDLRSERDLLEEILSLSRTMTIIREKDFEKEVVIHPGAIEELVLGYSALLNSVLENDKIEIFELLDRLSRPLKYIADNPNIPRSLRRDLIRKLEESQTKLEEYRLYIRPVARRRATQPKASNEEDITSES